MGMPVERVRRTAQEIKRRVELALAKFLPTRPVFLP
jgi:hypothetical protein